MNALIEIVKRELISSSHDFEHTMRVMNMALRIAKDYPEADVKVIEFASILHDIARVKEDTDKENKIDHAILGAEMSREILKGFGYDDLFINEVAHAIETHRYRSERRPQTLEAKIVSDADKLDAIGAIGIARAFAIAGEYREPLYIDVDEENLGVAKRITNFKEHAPNIEYFVKLRRIKELLYTESAKKLAKSRLEFMEVFFDRLKKEIKVEL
ncbi:MAG: HD domain-containing protein [Caldisericaceae bacterium]